MGRPDVVNAFLAATVETGVVGPIFDKLIEGFKYVYCCKDQCRALREELEKVKPMVVEICGKHKAHSTMQNWLKEFAECVGRADEILGKCKSDGSKIWDRVQELHYGDQIVELKDKIHVAVSLAPMALLTLQSGSTIGIEQSVPTKIFGMEDHFTRVKSSVLEGRKSESNNRVGIRGMGGAGKTLLAQMVNNDKEIQQVFGKDSVIWITVGRDAEISVIYDRMRKRLDVRSDGGSLTDQRTDLWNAFSNRSILLILDDVWDGIFHECEDMAYWLDIATGPGSVTLVTTRDESVTRKFVNARESVEIILRLPGEQSWELFCVHAFGTDTPTLHKDLEGLARDVCKECDCLPLALKVIGRAMKGKSNLGEWRNLLRRLQDSARGNESVDQQLFERLRFSYDQLDDPTKICFIYFAAFPEDYEVSVEYLCHIWKAEGLFGEDLDDNAALDEAKSAVNKLLDRSLIEDCSSIGWKGCVKMHDILRDLAIQLTRKGEVCVQESLFMMEKRDLEEFPRTWLGKELKVKRLSLWGNKIKRFPHNFIAPNLKICLLYPISRRNVYEEPRPDEGCEIEESFFYNLHALKYLQVCKFSDLEKLPESIGGLGSLQHLNLQDCRLLKQLPKSIGEMGSLQHLNLHGCYPLKELPESIGRLGSLQHLNLYYSSLKELPESIGQLGSLQHLDLAWCESLKQLPESIGRLGSLQHLDLAWCESLMQLPESIGRLGSLQHLNLWGCKSLKQLPESIGESGSLQLLNVRGCESLHLGVHFTKVNQLKILC